jgi:hypothetical protein
MCDLYSIRLRPRKRKRDKNAKNVILDAGAMPELRKTDTFYAQKAIVTERRNNVG